MPPEAFSNGREEWFGHILFGMFLGRWDIGALLSSDLDLTSGESEQRKTYGNRISYIPDIDREYPQFEMMLKVARNIMNINVGGKKTKTNLFVNIRDQWYRNLIASPQYFVSQPERDYFVTIARDLVLPFYLKADEKMDMTEIYKCLSDKADMVADTLTEKLTLETLRAYVDRWSRNRSVINSQKSEILGDTQKNILEDEWYPIIDDFVTDDGYSFKVLTNRDQLKQEAQKMQSCIGGFSELCLAGNAHVISGTAPDGEFFTMDVRVDRNDIFYLQEVAGFSGKANSCSVTSQEAAKMLVRKMNERSIEVGSEVGKIGEFESMERWLEFDPFNSEHRKAVTALYSEYKLVPSPFMKKGGMTFIKAFVGDSPEFAEEEVDLKFVIPKRKVSDAKKRGDRIELDDNITNPGPTSAFTSVEGVEISKLMESQKDSQEIGGG